MSADVLKYLKQHTCYYINLNRSPAREARWRGEIGPLFRDTVRVEATDGENVSDEIATKFVEQWNAWHRVNQPLLGVFMHEPQSLRRFNMKTAKANHAIRESHLTALLKVIDGDAQRAFISEDDVTPRYSLWSQQPNEHIDLPPVDADLAIWSGGLPMAAVRTDDKEYASGRPFEWVRITPDKAFNTLGAGLYEITRSAADHLHSTVTAYPMGPYDHAWGLAFHDLAVYRLRPNAFPQAGPSVRNHANRTPITERTKE